MQYEMPTIGTLHQLMVEAVDNQPDGPARCDLLSAESPEAMYGLLVDVSRHEYTRDVKGTDAALARYGGYAARRWLRARGYDVQGMDWAGYPVRPGLVPAGVFAWGALVARRAGCERWATLADCGSGRLREAKAHVCRVTDQVMPAVLTFAPWPREVTWRWLPLPPKRRSRPRPLRLDIRGVSAIYRPDPSGARKGMVELPAGRAIAVEWAPGHCPEERGLSWRAVGDSSGERALAGPHQDEVLADVLRSLSAVAHTGKVLPEYAWLRWLVPDGVRVGGRG